jgi:AraC family transcriptional regulator of adaptative response/methylated-DNA-[protein]-cysteine methyltransferase
MNVSRKAKPRAIPAGASAQETCDRETQIRWGVSHGAFGNMFLAQSPRGIAHLSFFDGDEKAPLNELRGDHPEAELVRDDALAAKLAGRIFSGEHDLQLHPAGTPFQARVWDALREIPVGKTTTYGALAARLGMPGAARAVGGAVGANRIALLIPCHRVIRSDGGLGGFRWGTERKRAMLAAELTPP